MVVWEKWLLDGLGEYPTSSPPSSPYQSQKRAGTYSLLGDRERFLTSRAQTSLNPNPLVPVANTLTTDPQRLPMKTREKKTQKSGIFSIFV